MLLKASCLLIVFSSLIYCREDSSRRGDLGGSGASSQTGGATSTRTSTDTDTGTETDSDTDTSTGTESSTNTNTNTNTPPAPLIIGGIPITADQASDCPNNLCLLTEEATVKSNRLSYSPSPTNSANIGTGSVSIKNYFRMVCLTTYVIDRWKPVNWQNCTNTNIEKFYIEPIDANRFYIHPAAQHNLCIEAPGTSLVTGVQLVLNTCDTHLSQVFSKEVSGVVTFYHPDLDHTLCIVRGGDSLGNLTIGLWTCDANNTNMMFQNL